MIIQGVDTQEKKEMLAAFLHKQKGLEEVNYRNQEARGNVLVKFSATEVAQSVHDEINFRFSGELKSKILISSDSHPMSTIKEADESEDDAAIRPPGGISYTGQFYPPPQTPQPIYHPPPPPQAFTPTPQPVP